MKQKKLINTASPLLLLMFANMFLKAQSDVIYPYEPSSATRYRINFNSNDFPTLRKTISEMCNIIIYGEPMANYRDIASPQCYFGDQPGPYLTLGVADYQVLTQSFQDCLTRAMDQMCKAYADSHTPTQPSNIDGTDVGIGFGVAIAGIALCFMGCCILSYLSRRCEEGNNLRAYRALNSNNPIHTGYAQPTVVVEPLPLPIPTPVPIIPPYRPYGNPYVHRPVHHHYSPPRHHRSPSPSTRPSAPPAASANTSVVWNRPK